MEYFLEAKTAARPDERLLLWTIFTFAFMARSGQFNIKYKSTLSLAPKDQSLFSSHFIPMWSNPVFTETLRKYAILPFLDRMSCSDYELPAPNGNGTTTLPAGTGVYIPVLALHHDPT